MVTLYEGPCTSRLENIQYLPKEDQIELLGSVALDIQSTIACIAHHLSQETIDPSSADPINDLAHRIGDINTIEKNRLRRKCLKMRRRQSWMKQEYIRLGREISRLGNAYKEKVERETRKLELRLSCVTQERDILLRTLYRKEGKHAIIETDKSEVL